MIYVKLSAHLACSKGFCELIFLAAAHLPAFSSLFESPHVFLMLKLTLKAAELSLLHLDSGRLSWLASC